MLTPNTKIEVDLLQQLVLSTKHSVQVENKVCYYIATLSASVLIAKLLMSQQNV